MNPSELRKNVLADHVVIRGKIKDVRELAARVLGGEAAAELQLRHHACDLVDTFLAHIDMEDEQLVPTLRAIDAWGQIRAERVSRDHEWQRAALEKLDETAKRGAVVEVVRGAETLCKALIEDMDEEDQTVLSPNILRDDPIAIDQSDG